MDLAEDEIDAYLCAYVPLYLYTWGETRTRVLGDVDRGYVITPVDRDAARRIDFLNLDRAGPRAEPDLRT